MLLANQQVEPFACNIILKANKICMSVCAFVIKDLRYIHRKYTAKVGQDNENIGVFTIFRLANTSLLQVYWMDKCLLQDLYIYRK